MTEIPGIVVPAAETELDEVLEEVGSYEPLMTFTQSFDESDEGWSGAFDAMIAAGLFDPSGP